MNRKEYNGDPRYAKVLEQMDLLGIMDITTTRQHKNGTIIWKLPIKKYGKLIEVGSFKSGYVRRMNGCYTPYQLNKVNKYEHYHKDYDGEWINGEYHQKWNGKYRKQECIGRIKIDNEIDRLEYLIAFCLKNYYIKQANMIEDGKFVPKWVYEDLKLELQDARDDYQDLSYRFEETAMELDNKEINKIGWRYGSEDEISVIINGHRYKVK